jgi:hypothetical protein
MKPRRRRGRRSTDAEAEDTEAEDDAPLPLPARRPSRAAIEAFLLGTVIGATPLGAVAMGLEKSGDTGSAFEGTLLVVAMLAQGIFWALLLRVALRWRAFRAGVLLVVACLVSILFAAVGTVFGGIAHTSPSLFPIVGSIVAVVLSPILLLTFLPVLILARRERASIFEQSTVEVSLAGLSWAAGVSALGLVLAPGAFLSFIGVLSLALALAELRKAHALVLSLSYEAANPERAAREALIRGLRRGLPGVLLFALVLLPLRVREQFITRNPAVLAIYEQMRIGYCDVRPAGSEGEVSLWLIDCGSSKGPMIGWDEREKVLIQGERLLARVPGATTTVSTGTPLPPGFSTPLVPLTSPASPATTPTH